MSETLSLDALRQEADAQFQDLTVTLSDGTEASLRSPVRLSTERRQKLIATQERFNVAQKDNDYEGLASAVEDLLHAVCDEKQAKKLVKDLNGDMAVTMVLLNKYMETAQVGEA